MEVRRGDIVLVQLDPVKGSEQGKTRPAVVVQNDIGNTHSPTTIVAPMTSSYDKVYPVNVEVPAAETGLDKDNIVLLNQIRTLSITHRITDKRGTLPDWLMAKVDHALNVSLGLA